MLEIAQQQTFNFLVVRTIIENYAPTIPERDIVNVHFYRVSPFHCKTIIHSSTAYHTFSII